jgi:hypothetical protein
VSWFEPRSRLAASEASGTRRRRAGSNLEAREVLCTDPHVPDPNLVPLERVLAEADVLFVATPHEEYRRLPPLAGKRVIDVWNCLQKPAAAV